MHDAKNLKLADALGISTDLLNQSGLPLSVVSANASSSRFSSIISAILFKILNRLLTGVRDHAGYAFSAAFTARAISFSLLAGTLPIMLLVAGSILSM